MPCSRATLALFALLCLGGLLRPAPAAAANFTQQWSLTGWDFVLDIGNTDGDPQHELLFASKLDGHMALVDGLTGVIAKEFPEFASANSGLTLQDVDGDGRPELFFWRRPNGPVTPLVRAYDWDGADYATLFSHTDPCDQWSLVSLRNGSSFEATEVSGNDVRVRDLSGTVLFRASTAIAGWTGSAPGVLPIDIDQDGLLELVVVENQFTATAKGYFFQYAAGFTPAWSVTGWQIVGAAHTDPDPQPEIIMVNGSDGRYALFDGISGALAQDFPAFTFFNASSMSTIDLDGDGVEELYFKRPGDFTTPLFTAYQWSGGSYTPTMSHTDVIDDFTFAHFRDTGVYDVLETTGNLHVGEVRVRDLAGNVLFRASTQLPGWSGSSDVFAAETDTDHDGLRELTIQDGPTLRFVRYAGAFTQTWSTTAWALGAEIPNTDGDAPTELVARSTADQHYAILDTPTGAVEREFPAFTYDDSYLITFDSDDDGRSELFFSRFDFAPPLLSTAYEWSPSGYGTLFSHTDAIEGVGSGHFRNATWSELLELAPNDLRVRELSGVVLFRASTDLAGWTGVNRDMQVVDVDANGVFELLAIDDGAARLVRFTGTTTSVASPGGSGDLQLLANAPNPFHTGTAFRFSTRAAGPVGIRVFDAGGRLVRRLDRHLAAGPHEIAWDGHDDQGRPAPSGMLFYEVTADGTRRSGRMVRLGR